MRLSVKKGDPGYRVDIPTDNVDVFVNGEEIKWCFTADEESGEAWAYEERGGDHLGIIHLKGKVEIREKKHE